MTGMMSRVGSTEDSNPTTGTAGPDRLDGQLINQLVDRAKTGGPQPTGKGRACRLAPFHRTLPARRTRRYPLDTTDAPWRLLDPLLPDPSWLARRGGRPEPHCRRRIHDGLSVILLWFFVEHTSSRRGRRPMRTATPPSPRWTSHNPPST